ncbi:2478_t:CDS:1, partial [Acaulospora morrowiae]
FINTGDSLIGKFGTQESSATSIFDDTSYNVDENNRKSNIKDEISFGMEVKSLLQEKE